MLTGLLEGAVKPCPLQSSGVRSGLDRARAHDWIGPALAEFRTMLLDHLGIVMEVEDLRKVWRALDDDSSGVCSFLEFCIAFFPHLEVRSHG